jgi:hypothetical protein
MYDYKRCSPGTALLALAMLGILQSSGDGHPGAGYTGSGHTGSGHPSAAGAHPGAAAVHPTDARHANRQTLPVDQPARLERSQPPSWVF